MSHDGSSCKSYIKHPTEKERLDHLAFTSFPEDYLPYASNYHQRAGGKAPPYLVWDERRPRRGRSCCSTTALVSAIALIVAAILAVVAISVYLGVVTNLFRSPVLSLSGKFRVSHGDDFVDELLNTTSLQFLTKAESYQAMVENAFLSSSLEPAFIAARIYAFRPGLLVFFRVYLDRRKLQADDSDTLKLIKSLLGEETPAFGALRIDRESVDVDENEEWISVPGVEQRIGKSSAVTKGPLLPPRLATAPPNKRPLQPKDESPKMQGGTGEVVPVGDISSEEDKLHKFSYGQWKPVPIEDSVSPSFGDQRTPPGRGNVRLSEALPANPPPPGRGNVRLAESQSPASPPGRGNVRLAEAPLPAPPPKKPPSSGPSNPMHVGVGSVSVLEDPLLHIDPIPLPPRSGRPLLLQDAPPQRGEVASSIMSSVSLVVRPPSNTTRNRTSESGSPDRNERPFRHTLPIRKEQASYRFLDEGMVGEGSVQLEPDSVEEENSSGSISGSFSSESQVVEGSVLLKESSVEYLSKTPSPDDMNSAPENLKLKESSVEYTKTDSKSDFSKDNSSEMAVPDTTTRNIFLTESSVEYQSSELVEERTLSDIYINQTENNTKISESKELTNPSGVIESVLVVNNSKENSWTPYVTTEFLTNFNETINNITSPDSEEIFDYIGVSSNEMEHKRENVLNIYSAKSDIGFSHQNHSNAETGTSLDEYDEGTPVSLNEERDSEEITFEEKETTSAILYTKYISTENFITEHQPDQSFEHKNASVISSTSIPSLFRDEESSGETTKYFNIVNTTKESEASIDISSSERDETSVPTEFEDESEINDIKLADSNDSQNHSINFLSKDSNPNHITMHTQQGHGFHRPLPKPSSANNSSTVHTTELPSSAHEVDTESKISFISNNPTESSTTLSKSDNLQKTTYPITILDEEDGMETSSVSPPSSFRTTDIPHTTAEELSTSGSHLSEAATNDSFVPKIVPQQSDLSFDENAIESGEDVSDWTDDDLLDLDRRTEIIRHITTLPPTPVSLGKHPVFISQKCADDEFQCESGECVDLNGRCNMRRDCRDNSDEKNCSCSELLRVMGQSQKICDGVEDCEDHSDEQNCPWCSEGQVVCPQNKFCINQSQVCDGNNDCPSGMDERYCVKLAENAEDARGLHYREQGFLMVRKEGAWGKLCLDNLHDSRALRLKLDELGEAVCSALTFRSVSESKRIQDIKNSNDTYYVISNEASTPNKRSSAIFHPSVCESREVMRVECGSLECGLRPMATSHRRRIVGGQSASSGSWPWQVALYKEGDFQCGAVLISDTWLISAGHCFYSTLNAHWVARLGLLRRGSELSPPSEQVRRVAQIFLHPNYEDKGFINDIALLRLDRPVLFSDYLRPVCLPTAEEDPGLWHGRQCSVVGWGKLYEIGHTFPDSLQEVRLPVISTEECRKRILFLTMYHITDNMFCAGYERGGRDACLGDSGGPLMCQREDGRWILLGVTSNGDGCGRPGRPGVYTKVANYLDWIHKIIEAKHSIQILPDSCEGVRCRLGRCIAPYKMCDGRWDCSEGKDEDHCFE
ncbi:uncharacterized protein LOC129988691 [Argiope bruennichi]|uniref:uncharacterized protein LOC129988691 n=1 Tax=Argiope bruennichi TaxID=94029 RepID=UPI002494AB35|nr:uncharacterized protein LOC129988691 [Argiope bruennichi]